MSAGLKDKNKANDLVPDDIELDLDLGNKVIKLAEKLGADSAEVFMVKGIETDFSIEKDNVNFASSRVEFGMGVRVIKNKRLGFGYCTNDAEVKNAIANALSTTKLAKQLDFEFVSKSNVPELGSIFDRSILELTVEEGLEFSNQLISSCKEVDKRVTVTGGGIGYGGGSLAILTSSGVELQYSGTGINGGVSTLIKDKTISTGYEYDQSRKRDLKPTELGRLAAELAVNGQNPKHVESGDYKVLFTPHALCELLEFTVIPGLYGEGAMKGETVYSNKLGESVANPELSFFDDGILENGINSAPFDDEGTPCRRTTLIEKGVLKNYLYDRVSALEFDENSTGNALRSEGLGGGRSYQVTPKTKALNFTIDGKIKPHDQVISDLDKGIMINELLGAHTANSASGDFSVNSPTLFIIEHGEITSAGKQVMLSGNMPELMNNIIAIGDDFRSVSGGLSPVVSRIPSIVIENIKVI